MELWKLSYSEEKVFKGQTRRSAGPTCTGDAGIAFPSPEEAIAAGWPRGRGGAGGSRAGFPRGLSSLSPGWCDSKGLRRPAT